jgi:hypothetical protein
LRRTTVENFALHQQVFQLFTVQIKVWTECARLKGQGIKKERREKIEKGKKRYKAKPSSFSTSQIKQIT